MVILNLPAIIHIGILNCDCIFPILNGGRFKLSRQYLREEIRYRKQLLPKNAHYESKGEEKLAVILLGSIISERIWSSMKVEICPAKARSLADFVKK